MLPPVQSPSQIGVVDAALFNDASCQCAVIWVVPIVRGCRCVFKKRAVSSRMNDYQHGVMRHGIRVVANVDVPLIFGDCSRIKNKLSVLVDPRRNPERSLTHVRSVLQ